MSGTGDFTGYSPQVSPFTVAILDAGGNILGDGPLVNVTRLDTTARLDAIGECTFEMPAADPRAQYITAGSKFDIWEGPANDRTVGYLGRYLYKSKRLTDSSGKATLQVTCYDALRELSMDTVAFRRVYEAVAVETVVADLISVVSGWQAVIDAGIGSTSVTYEGESPLVAIDVLRDRWGQHYRLQSTNPALKVLEFGAFGADSGIRLTNLKGQEQAMFGLRPEVAAVTRITLVEEADEIFNSIIAMGAGQGVSQITMAGATSGSYALNTGYNEDGTIYYYIQDAASVASYGERWKILVLPNVRPISNSATGLLDAANALKLMAEAYIARHLVPKVTYDIDVVALRHDVKVGDTVRLAYRGVVEGYSYIDVDDDFYVMDIQIKRNVDGARSAKLTIASVADRRTSDADVVIDIINDVKALKVHVPITLAYAPVGPYSKRMDSSNTAEFIVRIKDEVVYCNRALLRFRTSPLRSSVTSAASGGGSTSSSGGGGTSSSDGAHRHKMFRSPGDSADPTAAYSYPLYYWSDTISAEQECQLPGASNEDIYTRDAALDHSHTISAHTHTVPDHTHPITYGLFEDTTYPQTIAVSINGIDRTTDLGGPWALTNIAADVEVDITDYIVNAVGGVRQNHSIVFSCASGQGEIEAEIDLLVSIQSIVVS